MHIYESVIKIQRFNKMSQMKYNRQATQIEKTMCDTVYHIEDWF
jgi:hypothetical protein